jgi:hypothetical protein
MSADGLVQMVHDALRRIDQLERRTFDRGESRTVQPAEVGEVASSTTVDLSDGITQPIGTWFGGTPVVGEPALVITPYDSPPVGVLQSLAGNGVSFATSHGTATTSGSATIVGPTITVPAGTTVSWQCVARLSGTATGSIAIDEGGTSAWSGGRATDSDYDVSSGNARAITVSRHAGTNVSSGTYIPELDIAVNSGTVTVNAVFFVWWLP